MLTPLTTTAKVLTIPKDINPRQYVLYVISASNGREFVFGLIEDYSTDGGYGQSDFTVSISSATSGNVWIRAPAIGLNANYSLINGSRKFTISRNIIQTSNNTIESNAVHIVSDTDISVIVITSGMFNEEGFLCLPITRSSTKYIVPSAPPADNSNLWPSEFLVAAITNSTTISITLPKRFDGLVVNTTINISLSRYQTFQYQHKEDLSGTVIESSEPISVVAGTKLARIPETYATKSRRGSFVLEQLPSANFFGRYYIVPTLHGRTSYIVKIFTTETRASIDMKNSTGTFTYTVTVGKPLQIYNDNEPLFLSSDTPVYVVQYSLVYEVDNAGGDFMMNIPSVSNFLTRYDFSIPSEQSQFNNFLSIVSKSDDVSDIRLDSSPLSPLNQTLISTFVGNFTISTTIVSVGKHTITNLGTGKAFGALLYGYIVHAGIYSIRGYGYPLGMRSSIECQTTTPRPTSQTPSTSTYRTSTVSRKQGKESWCFSCPEVSHLFLCNSVTRCKDSEVCSVATYTTSSGHLKYRTGCLDDAMCSRNAHNITATGDCLECCKGDFCNAHGCNGQGFPDRLARGPLCFDCQHVESAEDCGTITLCHHDQVCRIEELDWGDTYTHLNMGCGQKYQCPLTRRSLPVCQNCCVDDFCNTNCTRMTGVPIIG